MTDARLAQTLTSVLAIEQETRRVWDELRDVPEKDDALIVMRQATALRKSLETWMARRTMRAQLLVSKQ